MTKICVVCRIEKEIDNYKKTKNTVSGIDNRCISCEKEYMKNYRLKKKAVFKEPKDLTLPRTCTRCKVDKTLNDFARNQIDPQGKQTICKECICRYNKENYVNKAILNSETEGFRQCKICQEIVEISDFPRVAACVGGRGHFCNQCNNEKYRLYRLENPEQAKASNDKSLIKYNERKKEFYTWLQTQECVDCGYADYRSLEFDHVKGEKSFGISNKVGRISMEALMKEIDKCEIRCSNCHKKVTAARGNYYRYMVEA